MNSWVVESAGHMLPAMAWVAGETLMQAQPGQGGGWQQNREGRYVDALWLAGNNRRETE